MESEIDQDASRTWRGKKEEARKEQAREKRAGATQKKEKEEVVGRQERKPRKERSRVCDGYERRDLAGLSDNDTKCVRSGLGGCLPVTAGR